MEYPYFKGLEADRYSFYRVPKALVKADLFQKMSGDAKLLYAVLLDRMSLSIKNGWQDKHGNAYIICTIEEIMDSIHCARQKAVKLLDELEQVSGHEAAHGWRRCRSGGHHPDSSAVWSVRLRAAGGVSRLYIINLPIYMPSSDHFAL